MPAIRAKSLKLTAYMEYLLLNSNPDQQKPFVIITPSNPAERGAQLSILLQPNMLDGVLDRLSANSVVVDERKPDVIRVAPAPLYNTFSDVWEFCRIFLRACSEVLEEKGKNP